MKKRISDALLGGFTGVNAGATTLGGLKMAGALGAGAVSPWAWGLALGGGALAGGISSLLSEDEDPAERLNVKLSNDLMAEKIDEAKFSARTRNRDERTRKRFSSALGSMFAGSQLAGPSGRLL